MQTILGAGGAIGPPLAAALQQYTDEIRRVSRKPKNDGTPGEHVAADLLDPDQVKAAVAGSEVAYLTAGLPYHHKIWQKQWPLLMSNVIEACRSANCKLVFFDNVYMYDPKSLYPMTEGTSFAPCSRKGQVRAQIARQLLKEMEQGTLQALIARSADFIGYYPTSLPQVLIHKNLARGKKANWITRVDRVHNFTDTQDAGFATALLGNTEDAYGQTWHLPSDQMELTAKDWIEQFATALGQEPRHSVLQPWMLRLVGIFSPEIGEVAEMSYQYEHNYLFDSTKFKQRFPDFPVSTPRQSIARIIKAAKS